MPSTSATPTASEPLLEIEGLEVSFVEHKRSIDAVRGMSLSVGAREFVALVGRSGCGKTLTLLSVLGLVNDDPGILGGSIRFNGEPIMPDPKAFAPRRPGGRHRSRDFHRAHQEFLATVRGRRIGLVLQDPYGAFVPQVRVGEQMMENLARNRPEWSRLNPRQTCREWLHRVGFPDADAVLERYPDQLSGGMSQRAMIAMILSMEPALLLADEPTSALDATVQLEVLELLSRINREEGTGVLLVTHDIGVAMRYAHRIAVASGGRVVEEGRADTFAESAARLTPESRELLESHYTLRHGRAEASAGPP